jgi:collagenase-like PrtC family protease
VNKALVAVNAAMSANKISAARNALDKLYELAQDCVQVSVCACSS